MITHNNVEINGRKCLVLGSGGTSQTVQAVLKHLGAAEILVVSRKDTIDTISYESCYQSHANAEVIVNTTPLGMYPNMDASPLDLSTFHQCEAVVDVIFNPLKTKLALQAEELGIKAVTGLEMLVAQAKQAVEYFLETKLEDTKIDEIYHELLKII